MRSSHKMVVTGAFGGLAGIVVLGSGAFACTETASIGIKQNGAVNVTPVVQPGQPLTVMVKGFLPADLVEDAKGNPVLDAAGKVQYRDRREIYVTLRNPYTGKVVAAGQGPGPGFEQVIEIPRDEGFNSTELSNTSYELTAVQTNGRSQSSFMKLDGGKQWDPTYFSSASQTAGAVDGPVAAPVVGGTITGTVDGTPAAATGVIAAPQGATQAAAAPAASSGNTPTGPQAATALPSAVAGETASIAVGPATPPENTAPPAAELWSALKADSSVNLLEPANGTTPPSGGAPAGGLALLGVGMLSMAAAAFEATRRRLVLAKVARRR